MLFFFFFSSRRRHTSFSRDWSSDVCSSDLLVKLVADADTSRLLGAHVIAEGAGEVIAAAVYALANHMTVAQMADLWCPYLTMAEALKLAAQTYTRDVSKLSCCAA